MLAWMTKAQKPVEDNVGIGSVTKSLARLYKTKLLPLEEHTKFDQFHSPLLDSAHFTSKPMVLLIGQYSTGKTTFLEYLVEKEFPGCRIGPEPTTDGFMVLEHNEIDALIPGNALVVDPSKPYAGLSKFGVNFMNKFTGSQCDSEVLRHVTLVDTPGILSGAKQASRGYDFTGVLQWWAERVDRIILLFDAHKLDISDELGHAIKSLKGNDDKIRIVLNKADSVNTQQLMRVYGALLWYLAKVFDTPEVVRVYTGSFWNQALKMDDNRILFEMEKADLFEDLQKLPRNYAVRHLSDLVKRCRLAMVHAHILNAVRADYGRFSGDKKKKEIIARLPEIYSEVERTQGVSQGDFPDIIKFRAKLQERNFKELPKFRKDLVDSAMTMMQNDIPPLMARINVEEFGNQSKTTGIQGGVFSNTGQSPFTESFGVGINRGKDENTWIVEEEKEKWDHQFILLGPDSDNKLDGRKVKPHFLLSKLPNSTLGKIWQLADLDKDGMLDETEFAIAMHLTYNVCGKGHKLPAKLPEHLLPPHMRKANVKAKSPVAAEDADESYYGNESGEEDSKGLDSLRDALDW